MVRWTYFFALLQMTICKSWASMRGPGRAWGLCQLKLNQQNQKLHHKKHKLEYPNLEWELMDGGSPSPDWPDQPDGARLLLPKHGTQTEGQAAGVHTAGHCWQEESKEKGITPVHETFIWLYSSFYYCLFWFLFDNSSHFLRFGDDLMMTRTVMTLYPPWVRGRKGFPPGGRGRVETNGRLKLR